MHMLNKLSNCSDPGRDKNAPPPPSLEEQDYVQCDSCGRTFSQQAVRTLSNQNS
eukprot:m.232537 g.232537  ORF g.232537 m.232537 type:complete len:54 (+) comp16020_c0_seq2:123-284(+)